MCLVLLTWMQRNVSYVSIYFARIFIKSLTFSWAGFLKYHLILWHARAQFNERQVFNGTRGWKIARVVCCMYEAVKSFFQTLDIGGTHSLFPPSPPPTEFYYSSSDALNPFFSQMTRYRVSHFYFLFFFLVKD